MYQFKSDFKEDCIRKNSIYTKQDFTVVVCVWIIAYFRFKIASFWDSRLKIKNKNGNFPEKSGNQICT